MRQNIVVGIIAVVILIAGGWWYFTESSSPSEIAQTPTNRSTDQGDTSIANKPLAWKAGDRFGDFVLTNLYLNINPPTPSYPYYVGTADFVGTTTIAGEYFYNSDYGDWEFTVANSDTSKIPNFPGVSGKTVFYLKPGAVKLGSAFSGKKGDATITVANYHLSYLPKGEELQDYATLVSVISDTPKNQ